MAGWPRWSPNSANPFRAFSPKTGLPKDRRLGRLIALTGDRTHVRLLAVRWERQRVEEDLQPALPGMPGLVRTVRTPEFAGIVFHEVAARSVLNKVPSTSFPFGWTINPYRGCSHACVYCFARNSHTYLDLNAGEDFNNQVIVKVNAPEVLARELRSPKWRHEHVAMGTNTDPYQRAEGRYRLMPRIIDALAGSATPFSVLTKGTLLARDLPLLTAAAERVDVGVAVSIAMIDSGLSASVEPGTPSPRARLELVRKITEEGLRCGVMVAPVLPGLSDSIERLDTLLGEIAAAGASGASVLALHLRPGAREWYLRWLASEHPELVPRYQALYSRGPNADRDYRGWLARRAGPLLRKHGLDRMNAGGSP
jgi:DNA repair photolyase